MMMMMLKMQQFQQQKYSVLLTCRLELNCVLVCQF